MNLNDTSVNDLTTSLSTEPEVTTAERHRPPATVLVAAVLACLVACVGGYGAAYFGGLGGWDEFGLTFLLAYEFLAALGVISAVALVRRSVIGWAGLVTYAVWMTLFTGFKVGYVRETQAIPFGVVALVVLALTLRPSARRYARRGPQPV